MLPLDRVLFTSAANFVHMHTHMLIHMIYIHVECVFVIIHIVYNSFNEIKIKLSIILIVWVVLKWIQLCLLSEQPENTFYAMSCSVCLQVSPTIMFSLHLLSCNIFHLFLVSISMWLQPGFQKVGSMDMITTASWFMHHLSVFCGKGWNGGFRLCFAFRFGTLYFNNFVILELIHFT